VKPRCPIQVVIVCKGLGRGHITILLGADRAVLQVRDRIRSRPVCPDEDCPLLPAWETILYYSIISCIEPLTHREKCNHNINSSHNVAPWLIRHPISYRTFLQYDLPLHKLSITLEILSVCLYKILQNLLCNTPSYEWMYRECLDRLRIRFIYYCLRSKIFVKRYRLD